MVEEPTGDWMDQFQKEFLKMIILFPSFLNDRFYCSNFISYSHMNKDKFNNLSPNNHKKY